MGSFALVWGAMVVGSLAAVGVSAQPAAADETGFQKVGSVDLKGMGAGILAVDPSIRRVVATCRGGCPGDVNAPNPAYYAVEYDADTMKPVAWLPASETRAAPLDSVNITGWTLDPTEHRLYYVDATGNFVVIDTKTLTVVSTFTRDALDSNTIDRSGTRSGLFYSPVTKLLYMVVKGSSTDEEVSAIDPHSNPPGETMWTDHLNQCGHDSVIPDGNQPIAVGVTKDGQYLYTICEPPQGVLGSSNVSYDIVRLTLPNASNPAPPAPPGGVAAPVFNGAIDLYPGLVTGGGGYQFDATWVPGLDRMIAFIPGGNNVSHAIAVFDAGTNMFISSPTLFSNGGNATVHYGSISFAVDNASGRLVAQSFAFNPGANNCSKIIPGSNAFAVSETALLANHLAVQQTGDDTLNPSWASLVSQMAYDSQSHNLWVPSWPRPVNQCMETATVGNPVLQVYHDGLPAAHESTIKPDANTQNIEESANTGANANAQASAFGARYEVAPSGVEGGLTHVYVTPATLTCDVGNFYYFQQFLNPQLPGQQPPPLPPQYRSLCTPASRTVTFAHVNGVSLDASEARADAIAADTNADSARDVANGTNLSSPGPYIDKVSNYPGGPTVCQTTDPSTGQTTDGCAPPAPINGYVSGQQAPYQPASCSDTGDSPQAANQQYTAAQIEQIPQSVSVAGNNVPATVNLPGYAAAGCAFGARIGSAAASNDQSAMAMPIFATSSDSSAQVIRTNANGTSATATASADGITLGGVLHIGRVLQTATVQAHGRPGTAKVLTYTCTVSGFQLDLPGQSVSLPSVSCDDSNLQSAVAQFNHAFTGFMHIDFPLAYKDGDPNAPLGAAGVVQDATPGGYQARVQASEVYRAQNEILLNDSSIEEPAMTVTLIDDTSQRHNRYVADFAAVAASATYGIFALPADGIGGGDLGSTDAGAPQAGSLGNAGGGSPELPGVIPPAAPVAAHGGGGGGGGPIAALQRLAQAIVDGMNVLLQHPGLIPPLLAVWALLGSPAYLLSRRRALVMATRGTL